MNMPIRILIILLIGSFYWAGQAPCEIQEKKQTNASAAKKETLNFKDPFSSALPKKKIIPKTVEQKNLVKPIAEVKNKEKEIIPPSLSIQGLIWNTNRPQAIVNEIVVGVGDTIEGAKIVSIQKTGISIIYEGKAFWVKKKGSSRKSGTTNQDENFSPQFPEDNTPLETGGYAGR